MRINTQKSIELGERIYEEYGSWAAVLKAAELRNGIYVLPPKQDNNRPLPDDAAAAA